MSAANQLTTWSLAPGPRGSMMQVDHKTSGHQGIRTSYRRASTKLRWSSTAWSSSYNSSREHCSCSLCQSSRWASAHITMIVFTALHVMQTRYSEENSVRPSVCLSVRHTRDPWQKEREICPDFYTIRKNIYPSFLRRIMVGGGRPLLPEILGQPTPVGAKSPIFNQ